MDPWLCLYSRGIAAVVGTTPPALPVRLGQAVVVDAAATPDVLEEGRRRLSRLTGPDPTWTVASRRVRAGLRRRLLGHDAVPDRDEDLAHTLNRLVAEVDRPLVLVVDDAEHVDPASSRVLHRAALDPGWLHLPILLVFRAVPRSGPMAGLARDLDLGRTEVPDREPAEVERSAVPLEARLVLRALAVGRPPVRVEELARLLRLDELDVLERLQLASEAGVRVLDAGDGRFALAPGDVGSWRSGLLPSLASAWTTRLSAAPPGLDPGPPPVAPPPPSAPDERDPDGGGEVAAFEQALHHGDPAGIEASGSALLERLASLPTSPGRRRLRLGVCLERARRLIRHAGGVADLHQGVSLAREARSLLTDDDPPALWADALATLAALDHEVGDRAALDEGLDALTEAMHRLQDAGDAVGASRLLNDQAAIWVRLGDPVRAAHLLRSSREVFAARAATDRLAALELAETDHLLARLPLHVGGRPGLEQEALEAALRHAADAIAVYSAHGAGRESARVLETTGRIEHRLGRLDAALRHLGEAGRAQQRSGDVLGLARTTQALAEVLLAQGRADDAVAALSRSAELNRRAGSVRGLAGCRETARALLDRGGPELAPALAGVLGDGEGG